MYALLTIPRGRIRAATTAAEPTPVYGIVIRPPRPEAPAEPAAPLRPVD